MLTRHGNRDVRVMGDLSHEDKVPDDKPTEKGQVEPLEKNHRPPPLLFNDQEAGNWALFVHCYIVSIWELSIC